MPYLKGVIMPKLTVNVSETLYEQIQAYAYSNRHNNSSEAIRELLTCALLQANERTYAPLIRTQVNEELNRFMASFNERLSMYVDDLLSDLDVSLGNSIDETRLASQAALFGVSLLARPTNPESFTEEALNYVSAFEKQNENLEYDELAEDDDDLADLD